MKRLRSAPNIRIQATACAVAMGTRARAVLAPAAPDAERYACQRVKSNAVT
jgi:hypothetical protein